MHLFLLREISSLARATVRHWLDDRAPRLGAALAYYVALSLQVLYLGAEFTRVYAYRFGSMAITDPGAESRGRQ